ncbi:MAG TPA: ATP-binding protein, partial [Bauldia sp.]|nr:ATP-binding protein [Bauldia sp.]
LVARELERDMPADGEHATDIALLNSQVKRCRDILAKITQLSGDGDALLARLSLAHLVEEVIEPYRAFGAEIAVVPAKGTGPEPVGRRNPGIIQGLANIVENAVDFAATTVEVASEWSAAEVAITIADDGPGFAPGIIDRLGEPYVTTRPATAGDQPDHEAGGLGLGVFIAKTLLERTGARLTLRNRPAPATGAVVRVAWPRRLMDGEAAAERSPAETGAAGTAWRDGARPV